MQKRILLAAVVLALVTGLAWAGGHKAQGAKKDPAAVAAKYQEKLGLTDSQTEQVRAVLEDIHQRYAALKARAAEGADIREEKKQLIADRDARLKAIFTAEQFARYQQLMAEYRKKKK